MKQAISSTYLFIWSDDSRFQAKNVQLPTAPGVIKLLGGSFVGVTTHDTPASANRKNRAISTQPRRNRNESRTFAPAHANHRLNYSLTARPAALAFPKDCSLKCAPLFRRFCHRRIDTTGNRGFAAFQHCALYYGQTRSQMLIREWWSYARIWLLD